MTELEALKILKDKQRAAQREPAKLDRSRWEGCFLCKDAMYLDGDVCISGTHYVRLSEFDFCPNCGRPLTEEAWAELERDKEDGRLVVLPCKLGGTVYANFAIRGDYMREKDKPYPCEVVFIGLSKEPVLHIKFKNGRVFPVKFSEVGKTVFLTRAEAAMKKKEEADNEAG